MSIDLKTKSGNKQIAIFMGLSYCEKHQYEGWYENSEHNHRICDIDRLQYHLSWDWLMKAVEKIENCFDGEAEVQISDEVCSVRYPRLPMGQIYSVADTKILATWNAVVAFVIWYQTQKLWDKKE